MVITYHGGEFIKVSFGDTTLAFNPISKKTKSNLKPTRFGADIAFVSANHPDFDGIDEVTRSGKELFTITGPGEYEVKSVFAKGFPTKSEYGGNMLHNTAYSVRLEGMNLLFLGAMSNAKIKQEVLEDMSTVDVLFLPIGGDGVLNTSEANKLAVSLEAKVIVPIHHVGMGEKDAIKTYLKDAGVEDVKPVDKLTLKKKDLETKNGEVVVLTAK